MFLVDPTWTQGVSSKLFLFGHHIAGPKDALWSSNEVSLIPWLQVQLAHGLTGISPVADHAWNLAFHLAMSLLVFAVARKFLTVTKFGNDDAQRQSLAFWGAVFFACHPLGTEAVNYAKCTYMQMVALEALAVCWVVLRYRETGTKTPFVLGVGGLLLLASFTYAYALPISFGLGAIVFCFTWGTGSTTKSERTSRGFVWGGVFLLGFLGWTGAKLAKWYIWHLSVSKHSGESQILTQSRVFWEYVSRMIVPTRLCSDHLVPWSLGWGDVVGVVALVGLVVLLVTCAFLAWKQRGRTWGTVSLLLLLISCPLVIRFPYFTSETMVEYRTYPSLPWVGMLWAVGISHLASVVARRFQGLTLSQCRSFALTSCAVIGILFSARRSLEWRSLDTLAESILKIYPDQCRVRLQLMMNQGDMSLHYYKEIQDARESMENYNQTHAGVRGYYPLQMDRDYLESHTVALLVVAELEGVTRGLKFGEEISAKLSQAKFASIDNTAHHSRSLQCVMASLKARNAVGSAQ